jgi:predicted O-methyltransferase YrrM
MKKIKNGQVSKGEKYDLVFIDAGMSSFVGYFRRTL